MSRQFSRSRSGSGSGATHAPPRHVLGTVINIFVAGALLALGAVASAQGSNSPQQLRQFISQQVGGLDKLTVPARDVDIPQPRLANGNPDPVFITTEAKRYLGKQLFHDPFRSVRVLPAFGGIESTKRTVSCGSCHLGEAASKAGTLLNFAAGGEGRGYTDAEGKFIPRRRPQAILPKLRQAPLFPGDALVDELPTLTDVYRDTAGIPSRANKLPNPGPLLRTGRLDALDSVGRNAPGLIGAAFNNRLLLGGFAGEANDSFAGLNPFGHPAQENLALLLLDAHRMLELQSAEIQKFPQYRKLFRDAFPAEAAMADAANDINLLINDVTVLRATATFMRTTVTRNTPFDKFLAGDNSALSAKERRGARLFFTSATAGGAGCVACHSGPMLNKQANDPDVTGVGRFVEENFINLGLGDHPVQVLNRAAFNNPSFRDTGRQEITGRASDAFKFRVNTLRQLREARLFMHSGEFNSVKDVVRYFNAGVPRDAVAGAAPTLDVRFTNPRGPGSPRGLGLSEDDVDDLTAFLEDGLHDPAFAKFDPNSPTPFFQLSERDTKYSVYRPDLAALGAIDGRPASGLNEANNDALSRRDAGLEFLNVSAQTSQTRVYTDTIGRRQLDVYRITNNSTAVIDTHLLTVVRGLPRPAELQNASGSTRSGNPYVRLFLNGGELKPGESAFVLFSFKRPQNMARVNYTLDLLSGQGTP